MTLYHTNCIINLQGSPDTSKFGGLEELGVEMVKTFDYGYCSEQNESKYKEVE